MKIISRWAATHARYAIPLIVLLNLLLGWLCYRLGMLLVDSGFRFPAMTSLLAFLALLLLAFAYPHPQKKNSFGHVFKTEKIRFTDYTDRLCWFNGNG